MTKLARAKQRADEWADQAKDAARDAAISSHFDHVGPQALVEMWQSNRPLSRFEFSALVERWLVVFGEFPPFDDDGDDAAPQEPAAPEPELPDDTTMLRAKDVVRITGVSLATLKRKVVSGDFPKPMRLSPRRIGWPARDVRLWLERLDGARQKTRT
jgi:prophage regulatory protein